MFIIFLRFSTNRAKAGELMAAHNAWLQQGFERGLFLVAGSLQPQAGGMILAHGADHAEIKAIVAQDPFVAEAVVDAEIHEVQPGRTDERLAFLKG
jgi:uncharacterized protein YciI